MTLYLFQNKIRPAKKYFVVKKYGIFKIYNFEKKKSKNNV